MIELKIQYPHIDANGEIYENLIKHYAEDQEGNQYYIIQQETGKKYEIAIDIYPSKYTYACSNEQIPKEDDGEIEN